MFTLIITHDGRDYLEGQYVLLKGAQVKIEHITATGFLYNHSATDVSSVTVTGDDGKQTHYCKNWDYLDFELAKVKISYV